MADNNYYTYGNNVQLGYGNFNLPPVLIGTIFYQNQTIVDRKNEENFDKTKAKKRIDAQKSLAEKYKIPDLIEISANTPKSVVKYLDFYLDNFDPPFILGGTFDARVAGIEHLKERGIKPTEYIYNAISNLKNGREIELIKKNKIESVVILILSSENMSSTQRYNYITKKIDSEGMSLIDGVKNLGATKIWIDGGVVNLESLAHILETQKMVSTALHLPVGTAPNLFLFKFSSPRLNIKFHTRYRRASIMFIASYYSNFIFYGAIEDSKESFASAYQTIEFKKVVKNHNIKLLD